MKNGNKTVDIKVNVGGDGLWSNATKEVTINRIEWYTDDETEETFVKLYLDENTWSQDKDGLIYTDKTFQEEMREILCEMYLESDELPDLPWEELSYTEQGMQGGHRYACPDDCTECKQYVHMILGAW